VRAEHFFFFSSHQLQGYLLTPFATYIANLLWSRSERAYHSVLTRLRGVADECELGKHTDWTIVQFDFLDAAGKSVEEPNGRLQLASAFRHHWRHKHLRPGGYMLPINCPRCFAVGSISADKEATRISCSTPNCKWVHSFQPLPNFVSFNGSWYIVDLKAAAAKGGKVDKLWKLD
jgi:hypothetical protein